MLRRRTTLLPALLAAMLVSAAMASAAGADVQLTASSDWVHKSQGPLTVTISRTDTQGDEYIRCGVKRMDALPPWTSPSTWPARPPRSATPLRSTPAPGPECAAMSAQCGNSRTT